MDIRSNPPKLIRLKRQRDYYEDLYDELTSNNVQIKTQDRYPLAVLAINLVIIEEATKSIQKHGTTITVQGDRNTITKQNPSVHAMKDAQAIVTKLFKEFQMTPASRPKMASGNSKPEATEDGWSTEPLAQKQSSAKNPFGRKSH